MSYALILPLASMPVLPAIRNLNGHRAETMEKMLSDSLGKFTTWLYNSAGMLIIKK